MKNIKIKKREAQNTQAINKNTDTKTNDKSKTGDKSNQAGGENKQENKKNGKLHIKDFMSQRTETLRIEIQTKQKKRRQRTDVNESDSSDTDDMPGDDISLETLGEIVASKSGYQVTIPLYVTAAINSAEKVRYYFEKNPASGKSLNDPNGRCLNDGSTPLHLAIRAKQVEVVKILVQNGADISLTDSAGDNILMRAIRSRCDANIINAVWPYRKQFDINHTAVDGMSALHLAAEQKWECCLNFLLHNKADPNIQNTKTGITPLMMAAAYGDIKIAENLLRAGAEILVEDFEGFTCIYQAYMKCEIEMFNYLLKHTTDETRELYIKTRLDYVLKPPIADEEKTFIVDQYFPLLVECTNHREFKLALYTQKAIHRIAYKMEEHIQSVDIVISGSHLMFCIMFKFSDMIDFKFVRQYLNCRGPDLTIEVTKYYTEVLKMSERDAIAVFLPIIGLAVIPEGRLWIKKHYLSVSEYINFFKKENLKQYIAPNPKFAWCLTKNYFSKIYKVWNHFYDAVNEIQTEQREKNMNELLEAELKEKEKQEKKKQKKKQKKIDHQKKGYEHLACEEEDLNEETHISASGKLSNSCMNENAKKDNIGPREIYFLQGQLSSAINVPTVPHLIEPELSALGDQWTTVQTKKHANRDKNNQQLKLTVDQPKVTVDQPNVGTVEMAVGNMGNKAKRGRKKASKVQAATQIIQTQIQTPLVPCSGTTRWADIAKVKPKPEESNQENHIQILKHDANEPSKPTTFKAADFPSLGDKQKEKTVKKSEHSKKLFRPETFTFYFHDECSASKEETKRETNEHTEEFNHDDHADITFLGEPVEGSNIKTDDNDLFDQSVDRWSWKDVAEIGEYSRRNLEESSSSQVEPVEIMQGIPDKVESNEIFIDDINISMTQNIITCPDQSISKHVQPLENCEYENSNEYVLQKNIQNAESYLENGTSLADSLETIPKWAEELEEFDDEDDDTVMDEGQSVTGDLYNDSNTHVTMKTDSSAAQDLVYTDPAIIGCGRLHKPNETLSQSNLPRSHVPRQLQKSRFLGTVIKNTSELSHTHDGNDTCRGHKGWSNKRRMKTKADECPSLSSKNWKFGEKLVENAQQLEREMQMEGVCYPESLRGNKENEETHFFPSFHDDTKLSAQIDPRNFSIVHRLQLMQLAERHDFIGKSIKSTQDETLFAYYASCAGLNKQQYYQMIEQIKNKGTKKSRDPLRELLEKQQNQYQKGQQPMGGETKLTWMHGINNERFSNHSGVNPNRDCVATGLENAATNLYNYQSYAMGCKPFHKDPKNSVVNPESLGIPIPAVKPDIPTLPPNQVNIYAIQTAQSAMQKELMNKIQDIYSGMLQDKIKSVRWKTGLWNMRNITVEKQMIISTMVIPSEEKDRCYISISRHDSTVLGFLTDGTEVAIRIIDGETREFTQKDLQYLVDMDVSKYFMVKYKDYCFHNGRYYIAVDLYEYTLTEYLVYLKREGGRRDISTAHSKLIWQLFRGLESLHQNCLMVHGELRPDNVVIDVDGNVRLAGYGLSRNVGRDGPFLDYTDEEKCWLAPEVLVHKQKVSFKSDIWVAGMMLYYILSGGKNPFGEDIPNIIWNIGNQGYAMDYMNEEAGHLLCTMLSINKSERPCISEALKHPYFWGQEKQLRFIIIAGSDVLRDIKAGVPMSGAVKDSMISIIGTSPCHLKIINWIPEVEPSVMREMKTFRQYKNNVVELVLFVYNCCTHFDTLSEAVREIIEEPCKYFLTKFPTLFMTVYRAIRKSSRAERTCYKAFF